MKKLFFCGSVVMMTLLVCLGFAACYSEVEKPTTKEYYTVKLGLVGEIIDVIYEPLVTRTTSVDDLYGIQVYSAPNQDSDSTTWTAFAYGLFDTTDDISINLLKGYKYKFVATMVRDGKNKIQRPQSDELTFNKPFDAKDNSIAAFGSATVTNSFNYQSSTQFFGLGQGLTSLAEGGAKNHPNTERFYGELVDYIPGDNGDKAKIHMKRTSFGAKFIAKGKLAKEGTLKIVMESAPNMELTLTDGDNQISDIFTFSDVYASWNDNQYTETIAIDFNWERVDGTVLPLGTHSINYKRNSTTVVTVKIENDGESGGLGFEIADSELGSLVEDGENDITIEDGEVVDTEVETNK